VKLTVFIIFLTGTYTGHYEPVKEMSDLLDEYETQTGHHVPIHGSSLFMCQELQQLTGMTS
jgi:glutamate/tyrosine decarboxylase-like PLP-dependent enzyme